MQSGDLIACSAFDRRMYSRNHSRAAPHSVWAHVLVSPGYPAAVAMLALSTVGKMTALTLWSMLLSGAWPTTRLSHLPPRRPTRLSPLRLLYDSVPQPPRAPLALRPARPRPRCYLYRVPPQ